MSDLDGGQRVPARIAQGLEEHSYAPPELDVIKPGDGNIVIVGFWRDPGNGVITKSIGVIMSETIGQEIARRMIAPSVQIAREMPDAGRTDQ